MAAARLLLSSYRQRGLRGVEREYRDKTQTQRVWLRERARKRNVNRIGKKLQDVKVTRREERREKTEREVECEKGGQRGKRACH